MLSHGRLRFVLIQFGPARLDAASSANLIAVLALSMSVGRISSGLIGDRMSSMICFPAPCRKSKERRLFHYALPMTIAGLANAGVLMWRSKGALTIYSAFVGLLTGKTVSSSVDSCIVLLPSIVIS